MKSRLHSHSRFAALALLIASSAASGCAVDGDAETTGEIASPLPRCEEGSTAPICNPGDPPVCKPRCAACGGSNGCGGICGTGACPIPFDTCGGGGVAAQCGHKVGDLRGQQTGFRNQGARDTCTIFASTALVEAAYKSRYGLNLDLSEQFLHHFQKSLWLNGAAILPAPEIQPETNGGGNIPWQMATLGRYGIPPESTLPYIGSWEWQNLGGWSFPNPGPIMNDQRALDDFMLNATPTTFFTPSAITATVLPQVALEAARYRPTSVKQTAGSDRTNLAWYKAEIDAGREIAFDVNLTQPDPTPNDGIWDPGPNPWGQHAMLIVGYDDSKQAFWVKNSWGGSSFDLFSYSWITNGQIYSAATILAVADPYAPFTTFENKHLALGRWNLDFDGWHGDLDLYRLPGDGSPSAPDRRMGTYYGPDGVPRRVNGTISGNRLDLYIDWNNPNQPTNTLTGNHFITYIYGQEKTAMAGLMMDTGGNRWSVTAQKGQWVTGIPHSPAYLGLPAYSGHWQLDTDGTKGDLAISANSAGQISGSFTTQGGLVFNVIGSVTPDPRVFSFVIQDGPQWSSYSGYLNGHALGIMAGAATKNGIPVGFHASRTGDL